MNAPEIGTATAPIFFQTPSDFRAWFDRHHHEASELYVGFHKRASGKRSITWPEAVDEALCFGWIDGIRRSLGADSYNIRFTPRRKVSIWSAVNIDRVAVLIAQGRMEPAGLKAFSTREEKRSRIYSYEQANDNEQLASRPQEMPAPYAGLLQEDPSAWKVFQQQSPSGRKKYIHWLLQAKGESTRLRRLEKIKGMCNAGKMI